MKSKLDDAKALWAELQIRAQLAASASLHLYTLAAVALGLILGFLIAFTSARLAVLVILAVGVGVGYAVRSFVSYRRRRKWMERE
ncbi:hypothetical protein [Terrarubrum flagellatum]|uniref:hypothetical protein n=1 Tax=Terrirubrum flagellatum TaxID=2895980 RepID=UPI0031452AC3